MTTRRAFLKSVPPAALGVCALGAVPALVGACASTQYVRAESVGGRVRVAFASLDASGRALVEVPGVELPIFVRRIAGGAPVALSTRCMHRGCEVEPTSDRLVCPCHGSEYDLDGRVLEGPTTLPLVRYAASETADAIVIDLTPRSGA